MILLYKYIICFNCCIKKNEIFLIINEIWLFYFLDLIIIIFILSIYNILCCIKINLIIECMLEKWFILIYY